MSDTEFDAKGDWLPAKSRIDERARVLRDLRASGYEIAKLLQVGWCYLPLGLPGKTVHLCKTEPVAHPVRHRVYVAEG